MDDDIDSSCSTPFASAPSSPGRSPATGGGYFFSAPASPIHHLLLSSSSVASGAVSGAGYGGVGDAEFEFGGPGGPMISADELFHNGQIRPLTLPPLPDLDPGSDDDDGGGGDFRPGPVRGRELTPRSGSVHRRTRSMSPLRGASPRLKLLNALVPAPDLGSEPTPSHSAGSEEATPPVTASSRSSSSSSTSSSSSSSSSARGSRRWVFLKDMLLHRSKSEPGGAHAHDAPAKPEKAWQFSPSWASSRDRIAAKLRAARSPLPPQPQSEASSDAGGGEEAQATRGRARGGKGRRRSSTVAAAHERLYAARNRAQAEEMRRRTFLPYRQGLLGCLGFSSRGYGALHGFTKTLNPVFSR
uniref:Calmodulin-binding protein-like n=1 Tax=Oryza glumipatula TaxID=40148 RepID=A0A0D9Z644_9ORYZ